MVPRELTLVPAPLTTGDQYGRCSQRRGRAPGAKGARPQVLGPEALLQAEGPGRSWYLSTSCSSRSSGSQSESGSGSRLVQPGVVTPREANPQRATTAQTRLPSHRFRATAMLPGTLYS